MSQELTVVKEKAVFAPTQEDYKEMTVGDPKNMLEVRALADYLSRSKFIPQSFRGDISTAVMLIVTCKQYNLPITALSEVMEVNGKVGFWGRTKLGIVLKSGICEYLIPSEQTEKKCTIVTKRKGWPKEVTVSYTIEQAEKAGLLARSDAWKKHPSDMLYWRAVSRVISQVYPDVIQGFATVEEAEEENQLPQVSAVAMPEQIEEIKPKRKRRVKAEVIEQEEKAEIDEAVANNPSVEKKEEFYKDVVETPNVLPTAEAKPVRRARFIKQVKLEGGERYVVAQNPILPSSPLDTWIVPSAAMASELKKLTGMHVALYILDGKVTSYEEIDEPVMAPENDEIGPENYD